ncbi:RNA polymerase sigma factor [Pandoraea apista]|uniref:RNA polymerase sigma factor n=1 Tax=Pandoraea apista TaxID=93218 RepID=A0A0B5F872_9BURK|nr:RNA polymerase sigma factor [Pandoraea apista]AJE97011.1 hypothetical protein SG18_00325 [Pandoraea apista]AKH70959.1 hypothetical protein XM39_00325 [Pandoraea apista]AKI63231.1 hypothetical protein AA956_17645 [Pandoraea apista]ALS67676.1 hypothetical protein AT395_24540 [Pandoraea apista]OXS92684.1 hypothetical protein B7H01_17255 [Pandoraea apista]
MTENVGSLPEYLTRHYHNLKRRLTRLLGSSDLAGDALHDAWVKLQAQEPGTGESVHSPGSYLVRVAVNIALDAQRKQSRSLSFDEVDALLHLSDTAPGPARVAEDRSELEALMQLMERLPERRRQVLLLVRWEGLPQKAVAERLGVSLRVVENELRRAHDFLDEKLKTKNS